MCVLKRLGRLEVGTHIKNRVFKESFAFMSRAGLSTPFYTVDLYQTGPVLSSEITYTVTVSLSLNVQNKTTLNVGNQPYALSKSDNITKHNDAQL